MMIIILNGGHECLVDDEDYENLNQYRWQKSAWGYAVRSGWDEFDKFTTLRMHRIVMKAPKGSEVDHINWNKLDNRKENLRFVEKRVNVWNRPAHSNNRTGVKGVGWHRRIGKFQARLRTSERLIHIGYFNTIEEARLAYNAVVLKERGEHAILS